MPFASQAQRRKFYADPKLRKYIPEYEAATKGKKIPARVRKNVTADIRGRLAREAMRRSQS